MTRLLMLSALPVPVQLSNMIANNTEITLTVTIEEANNLLAGLQELPARICNPLTLKLQKQAQDQLPAQEVEKKAN